MDRLLNDLRILFLLRAAMKTLFQTWLLTCLLYLQANHTAFAQAEPGNHFDVNVSLSSTDALSIGMRYSFGQNDLGINIGCGLPRRHAVLVIPSISYYRHLWGKSKYTEVMPWYLKAAGHFTYSESELTRGNISDTRRAGARLYLGRDFNLSSRLVFSTAIGPILIVFEEFYNNHIIRNRMTAGTDLMIFYRL